MDRDDEGFRAAAHQFDPDPTVGRHPRAAIGLADGRVFAVACDGRSAREAGLTLTELARFMAALGCRQALNLDGGGSTALISGGRLQNFPRRDFDVPEPGGRPLATALTFHRAVTAARPSAGHPARPFTGSPRLPRPAYLRAGRGMVTAWSQIVHSGGGP